MNSQWKRALTIGACALSIGLVALPASAQSVTACSQIPLTSGVAAGAGATNGIPGTFLPGDVVSIAATLGTASAATFRIVGDPAGAVTLAGPLAVPGNLTYAVTGPLPGGSIGIGWFVDTANGTVNITASCTSAAQAVPTLSEWSQLLLILALIAASWVAIGPRTRT